MWKQKSYIGSKIAIPHNSHHASALYSARALSACRLKRACKYSSTFTVKVYFNFINTIKNVFSIMLPPTVYNQSFCLPLRRMVIFQISPSKKLSIVPGDLEIEVAKGATHTEPCSGF